MKKVYAVALDSNEKEQNTAFKEFIKEHGYGWWYWIDGFWLITDSSGELTASKLRTYLNDYYPKIRRLVLELNANDIDWAGYGPTSEEKNMFGWLKRNL